jgi:hypothetical protein
MVVLKKRYYSKNCDSAHPEPVEGWAECEKRSCFDKLNMGGLSGTLE